MGTPAVYPGDTLEMLMMRHKKEELFANDDDHDDIFRRIHDRINRVGIETPKVEVRFEELSVEGEAYGADRALPTLINATINLLESALGLIAPTKQKIKILRCISGIIKPSRMTLLLGPPGAGKTTLLLALAGKLDHHLKVSGKVTYCGHELHEFVPQRTCAYVSPHSIHTGEMTVKETLDFSGRCLGVGTRNRLLEEILRREMERGIEPDPEIDEFMKAMALPGQETSLFIDYVIKRLGLGNCANTIVGDQMRRGISGGEKKRLTTGEMLVGPAKVFFMDEISNGLDSSTTFQIIKFMKEMVHFMDETAMISLLQPDPETYNLFDDVILLSEGQVVYQGPRKNVLEFFEYMGFKCPDRKGVADFLQEVTSKKDQEQYWTRRDQPYSYITVDEFSLAFKSFHIGKTLNDELSVPYEKSKTHPFALTKEKYGISSRELVKACFAREWLLLKRNSVIYIFKTVQIAFTSLVTVAVFFRTEMHVGSLQDGGKFLGAIFFSLIVVMFNGLAELLLTTIRLPVFFKQRDSLLYPPWSFSLPIWLLRIPLSVIESGIWVALTYYTVGYAPNPTRFFREFLAFFAIHQMALSLFRLIAAIARTEVLANSLGTFVFLMTLTLGGFIVSRNDIASWMIWGYYASPMMYGQTALVLNEFLDKRWSAPNIDPRIDASTVGEALLKARGFLTEAHWFWISIAALLAFSLLFNGLFIVMLTLLNPLGDAKHVISHEGDELNQSLCSEDIDDEKTRKPRRRGMVLPFQPLSLVFNHINYYVDMPHEMKVRGLEGDRLQLLRDISGAFRPGILTALVGVTGAGKTTLMDVLAGRKTGGYMDGSILISGYPKNQATFARVSGYCEQNDIHSPNLTVYESLLYSAWLRLSSNVKARERKMFVEELIDLVELDPIRDVVVGLPGVDGLSIGQRKRLTIGVELVANPSIIFMDEPTTGLDARAAAIVMRTVRNTVDTGRTVVCTIHQPSIDIFESFDELLLMKLGGQVIYGGPLGRHSYKLVEYFQAISGVPKIREGYNPATWMLEVTSASAEAHLNVNYAEIYANSSLYQRNQELIRQLSSPSPGSEDLFFPTKYSQPFHVQCIACFWKQHWSYWRNPSYNLTRFVLTIFVGALFGVIFWNKGDKIEKQQDLINILGALYCAFFFLGGVNSNSAQPVVDIERTVFYRERASGMYSALPYAFAQVVVEAIYVAVQTIIYTVILYTMIGFEWGTGTKFLWFLYYMMMCLLYSTMFGMMAISLTPNAQISAVMAYFFLTLWNLFSGFVVPRKQIPVRCRWYYWATPFAWSLNGLFTSLYGDKNSPLEVPGIGNMTVKGFLKDEYGFHYDFLPVVAGVHVVWVLIFVFVFAYSIKFLNFQTR